MFGILHTILTEVLKRKQRAKERERVRAKRELHSSFVYKFYFERHPNKRILLLFIRFIFIAATIAHHADRFDSTHQKQEKRKFFAFVSRFTSFKSIDHYVVGAFKVFLFRFSFHFFRSVEWKVRFFTYFFCPANTLKVRRNCLRNRIFNLKRS